jgi:O-6-methylguanine DNA methyltransferase
MTRLVGAAIETPVGSVLAVVSDRGLCGLPFTDDSAGGRQADRGRNRFDTRLRRWFGTADLADDSTDATLQAVRDWLDAYFAGRNPPPAPPLDLRGGAFETTVWTALLQIPIGTTTSYGEIARRIGNPNSSRAVGLANGANPVPIIVPCHRVIGASGSLVGYGGGLERKKWLLMHEGKQWGKERVLEL